MINKIKKLTNNKYSLLILISWIVLIICLFIKLFGGNWFELDSENDKFKAFCLFVDNNLWLKMIIACMIYLFTTIPIICIILNEEKFNFKLSLIFIPLMITKSILGWYNVFVASIIDIVITLVIPVIINRKLLRPIITIGFVLLFQAITLVIRNIQGDFTLDNSFLVQSIYQIDYYIMILLFYLYTFKREE